MHVVTHLSEKYEKMRNSENGWTIEEAGMAQLDDIVGSVMQKLKDAGIENDTIIAFTTDNGAENFTWPDGGQTPFAGGKGTVLEGGFRVPMILRWPGKVPAGKVENQIVSGLDWFPTLVPPPATPTSSTSSRRANRSAIAPTRSISTATTRPISSPAKARSKRSEIFYFAESTLGAVRINDFKYRFIDQPRAGSAAPSRWTGRSSPTCASTRSSAPASAASLTFANWYTYEFWRFVFVKDEVGKYAQTFIDFPPMQPGASFNLEDLKVELEKKIQAHGAQ